MKLAQLHGPHVSGEEGLPQLQRRDGVLLKTKNTLNHTIQDSTRQLFSAYISQVMALCPLGFSFFLLT